MSALERTDRRTDVALCSAGLIAPVGGSSRRLSEESVNAFDLWNLNTALGRSQGLSQSSVESRAEVQEGGRTKFSAGLVRQ